MADLISKFREHIREEDMDDSMLSFYLEQAEKYVENATGSQTEYLIIMVAGIMYEYRVSENDLEVALNALTPFFVQEVYTDAKTPNEST
ncbi:head-tail connector protein [Lysinibacillus sp. JNUCC 51]|uniref:head-tail connector protein n=1 Tax=Lysinibacillus sp. JNUCC-51 TaxID=2792479 RepID=UPI001934C098|nr:phage gp6-like head-tail connector protein [Lysinibacillus sp. JNUCC-51]